jgi:hypothetical protein
MVAMTVAPLTCRYPKEISCFMCLFSTSWSESWSIYIYNHMFFDDWLLIMLDKFSEFFNHHYNMIVQIISLQSLQPFFYIFWRWTWMFMVVSMFDTFYLMKPLLDSRHDVEWKNRQRFWTQAKATKWWIQLIKHACGEESRCWFMLISLI